MDMGPEMGYQMFGIGEKTLGGVFNKPKQMPGPSIGSRINVADAKKTAEAVKSWEARSSTVDGGSRR